MIICKLRSVCVAVITALTFAGAASAQQPPVIDHEWTNSLGVKFVPAGTEGVLFSVWDVRVKDYQIFVQANPGFDAGKEWKSAPWQRVPESPVSAVSWNDAHAFCDWLTKKEQAEGKLTSNQRYRLPTDVEWSQAIDLKESSVGTPRDKCGKVKGVWCWGTQWPPPPGSGNYLGEKDTGAILPRNWANIAGYNDGYPHTSPVGSYPANRYGLYDMGGNVWQWCEDLFDATENVRTLRGASWNWGQADGILASIRDEADPEHRLSDYGFRCVLVVSP